MFAKILRQTVPVRQHGRVTRMSHLEVALTRLVQDAMKGDAKARALMFKLAREHTDRRERSNRKAAFWWCRRP